MAQILAITPLQLGKKLYSCAIVLLQLETKSIIIIVCYYVYE